MKLAGLAVLWAAGMFVPLGIVKTLSWLALIVIAISIPRTIFFKKKNGDKSRFH